MENKAAAKKPELIECEVMRAIGVEMSKKEKEDYRATLKNGKELLSLDGLTKMVYPSKTDKPAIIGLEKSAAKKLQQAGAVRVVI